MIKQLFCGALSSILFSYSALAQLTPEQQIARDEGIVLYQQSTLDSAQLSLRIAAEAGDPKAQYYLGEALRLYSIYTPPEARKWYEAAANQGDLYSMLRLSSAGNLCRIMVTCDGQYGEEWREQALRIARKRAEKGDTEAMTVLYIIGQGLGWLEKAAKSGDSEAQNFLAIVYEKGEGWFLIPGSRDKAVEQWHRASANGGYARGMYDYANLLHKRNRPKEEVGYWLKKTAEAGHIEALGGYALNVAHLPDSYGFPLDLVEAYGLTYLLSQLQGGGVSPENGRRDLPKIAEKMTPQEIHQGIAFAKEWEKTHPPLSYYDPIYGY